MCEDEAGRDSFEDMIRSVAREISRSAERISQFDVGELAGAFGIDAGEARNWMDGAQQWLRSQFDQFEQGSPSPPSEEEPSGRNRPERERRVPDHPDHAGHADRPDRPAAAPTRAGADAAGDPLRNAGPHPLDVPTEEQGVALAALVSGRWTVEPGSNALAARGGGPGPSDALGLVRELRVRDWIAPDGEVTPVGRHALSRWLDAAGH